MTERADLLAELIAIHQWQDRYDTDEMSDRVREIHDELNR